MTLTTANQIANYFIHVANETGSYLSNLNLQKLVYYAQAWHLALYDAPLFEEDFEAWVHGPVIPSLYGEYRLFGWRPILKEVSTPNFPETLQIFLQEVTEVYFSCDAFDLERMTHHEEPWLKARGELQMDAPSQAIISKSSMRNYYKDRVQEQD